MAGLDPSGGVLLSAFENEPALAQVQAVGFDAPPSMSWSVSPSLPQGVAVEDGPGLVEASWERVIDLFPLVHIRYLQEALDSQVQEVAAWADLPADAAEVTEFLANGTNMREYALTVTATGTAGGQPASADGSYQIQIWHQYDINRDIMKGEVDARR